MCVREVWGGREREGEKVVDDFKILKISTGEGKGGLSGEMYLIVKFQ